MSHAVIAALAAVLVEGCHRRQLLLSLTLLGVSWVATIAAKTRIPTFARHTGHHTHRRTT